MFLTQLSVVVIGNSSVAFFCLIKSNHITDMGTLYFCTANFNLLRVSGQIENLFDIK